MHGLNVHGACIDNGDEKSGCSCHIVTEDVDGGEILKQYEVPVLKGDTPEKLRDRILPYEHRAIVEGLCELLKKLGEK